MYIISTFGVQIMEIAIVTLSAEQWLMYFGVLAE